MALNYSKNCILKGTVDFYCLVCETYVNSEAEKNDHIAKPIHRQNLEHTQYVKDFEEDFVRKIKKRYFCEICNKLLLTMVRVKIHVTEPLHTENKNLMYFERIGVNVIAFGNIVLNENTWNGLNDNSCAFCNIEYEDEGEHKNLLSHVLNIIQIKVEVDKNKNIYRKIDDDSFQCLTCNLVLALSNIKGHFEEDEHKNRYQECRSMSLKDFETNKYQLDNTYDQIDRLLNNNEVNSERVIIVRDSDVRRNCEDSEKITAICETHLPEKSENIEQVITASGSDVKIKYDDLEENTAIITTHLNEKESKIAINSVNQEFVDSKDKIEDFDANVQNKTDKNKEGFKAVKEVKKKNVNLEKSKVNTKINTSEKSSNEIKKNGSCNKTNIIKSSIKIEEYEKKICKILKTNNYITLDENGKTLCILCDWIMDPGNKKIHITGQHHQTLEKLHKRRLAKIGGKNNEDNTKAENTSILDFVNKFQANKVDINLLSNTAVCKKCTVNLPYDVNAIEEHILKHDNESKDILESCKAIDNEICQNTGELNNNKRDALNNQDEEKLDDVKNKNKNAKPESDQDPMKVDEELISNESCVKEESELVINKTLVMENPLKQSLFDYVNTLSGIKHGIFNDVILNKSICISVLSFNYMITIKGEMKCLICDGKVLYIEPHINTLKHIKLLNEIPIIIKEKSEFIREIRPDLLHCGFCNMTVTSWSEMQEHLNSSLHKENRNASQWRLQLYSDNNTFNSNPIYNSLSDLSLLNMFCGFFK